MAAATRRTLAHPVRVYLGTMTFGWDAQTSSAVGLPEARTFLERFDACGGETIDSARIYAAGRTETILGDAMISASEAPRSPKRVTTTFDTPAAVCCHALPGAECFFPTERQPCASCAR